MLELGLAEQARPLLDQFDPGIRALDSLAEGLAALGAGTKPPPLWDAGVTDAVGRIEDLVADFWPDDESVDDFLTAIESRD